MNEPLCAQIGALLREADPTRSLSSERAAHIASCARCRGLLALLLATQLPDSAPAETSCADCQDELPAYVDLERSHGPTLAAQSYPAVWWHLWTCPDCAEAYQVISLLADAEAAGALATPRFAPTPAQPARAQLRLPQLRVQRSFLAQVFAMQTLAGVGWGSDEDGMVLAEGEEAGYAMSLSVQQRGADACVIIVTVEPPVSGQLVVRFGTTVFRAPFDLQGVAQVEGVPLQLLAAADGPEMLVSIEPEQNTLSGDDPVP